MIVKIIYYDLCNHCFFIMKMITITINSIHLLISSNPNNIWGWRWWWWWCLHFPSSRQFSLPSRAQWDFPALATALQTANAVKWTTNHCSITRVRPDAIFLPLCCCCFLLQPLPLRHLPSSFFLGQYLTVELVANGIISSGISWRHLRRFPIIWRCQIWLWMRVVFQSVAKSVTKSVNWWVSRLLRIVYWG